MLSLWMAWITIVLIILVATQIGCVKADAKISVDRVQSYRFNTQGSNYEIFDVPGYNQTCISHPSTNSGIYCWSKKEFKE